MAKKKPKPLSPDEPTKDRSPSVPTSTGRASDPGSQVDEVALERAREIASLAAQSFDPRQRLTLAKQVIATSSDCAEGYLLLAEMAKTRKQALGYYEQAVAAAARVLGSEIFQWHEGSFWSLIETRPYMTARLGLAEALWASGRRLEATDHLEDMLRLNPGDNQGLRYVLAGWLLNLDQLDRLEKLLASYDEGSTTWAYTKALMAYRRGGDTPQARKFFLAAKKSNKHVTGYLLGHKPLPAEQPGFYSPGDENDAMLYVVSQLSAWKSIPGAIAWVRSKVKPPRRRQPKAPVVVGPSSESQARLRALPSELDAWQADYRQFTRRVEIAGQRVRPWMFLVSSRTRELVLAHALTEQAPSLEEFWDIVAGAMENPAAGTPHRPSELSIRPGPHFEALVGLFEAIGVVCSSSEELDQIDFLFNDLSRHMAGADPPGMLDMPGVQPEQVGEFFQAAAEFYRRAPWRSLGYEAVIRVECDRYQSGPWFAVLMGQSGLTLGLALYEDLALLKRMWAGKLSDEEGARRTVALTVTFDNESTIPEADLEAIERHGWTVVSPDAYPAFFRKERGLSMRPPLSWEIELMDACLRVLPDFVARRSPDDPTRELVPVPGASPALELGLSWIEESY